METGTNYCYTKKKKLLPTLLKINVITFNYFSEISS